MTLNPKRVKTDTQLSTEIFIFNLGRLWQEASSEHWGKVMYLYEFIYEVTDHVLLKKFSKSLKKLQIAIEMENCNDVDKALRKILKW